jgi:hypothetical protein
MHPVIMVHMTGKVLYELISVCVDHPVPSIKSLPTNGLTHNRATVPTSIGPAEQHIGSIRWKGKHATVRNLCEHIWLP